MLVDLIDARALGEQVPHLSGVATLDRIAQRRHLDMLPCTLPWYLKHPFLACSR